MRSVVLIPFSVRNIWWLILILGIFSLQFQTLAKIGGFQNSLYAFTGVNENILNDYLLDFFRVFIISIVAYIATNIIRELTLLRNRYVKGAKHAEDLNEKLNEIRPHFVEMKERLLTTTFGVTISAFSDKFLRYPRILKDSVDNYIHATNKLTAAMNDSMPVVDYDSNKEFKYIQQSLLSARTSLIKNQAERIKAGLSGSVLTTWSNLGTISKYLMKNVFDLRNNQGGKITIYALQLKTPKEFVEKYFNGGSDEIIEEARKWREFVNQNIKNVGIDKVRIKRYFAKIDKEFILDDLLRPEEYDELIKAEEGLNDYYFLHNNVINLLKKYSDSNGDNLGDPLFSKEPSGSFSDKVALKDLLGKQIHKIDHCFIRTFENSEQNLILEERPNYKSKFIDYLAVYLQKEKGEGEWLFCVKSLYDKGFDAAKITLLHKKQWDITKDRDKKESDIWKSTKEKLTDIFLEVKDDNCKEISSYT